MIFDYSLFDQDLIENNDSGFHYKIWTPQKISIILGQSNSAENSLNIDIIKSENIAIYKRPSGGESVVLTPNNLILSIKFNYEVLPGSKVFFNFINNILINLFNTFGVNVDKKGISDLAIGDKKILGSSIYRRKNELFYHAVINVSENNEIFEKYLKHPEREPDYREGRSHREFVTSIKIEKPNFDVTLFQENLRLILQEIQKNPELIQK